MKSVREAFHWEHSPDRHWVWIMWFLQKSQEASPQKTHNQTQSYSRKAAATLILQARIRIAELFFKSYFLCVPFQTELKMLWAFPQGNFHGNAVGYLLTRSIRKHHGTLFPEYLPPTWHWIVILFPNPSEKHGDAARKENKWRFISCPQFIQNVPLSSVLRRKWLHIQLSWNN